MTPSQPRCGIGTRRASPRRLSPWISHECQSQIPTNLQRSSKNVAFALPIQEITDTMLISPEMMEHSEPLEKLPWLVKSWTLADRFLMELLSKKSWVMMQPWQCFFRNIFWKIRKFHLIQSSNGNGIKESNAHMLTTFGPNFETEWTGKWMNHAFLFVTSHWSKHFHLLSSHWKTKHSLVAFALCIWLIFPPSTMSLTSHWHFSLFLVTQQENSQTLLNHWGMPTTIVWSLRKNWQKAFFAWNTFLHNLQQQCNNPIHPHVALWHKKCHCLISEVPVHEWENFLSLLGHWGNHNHLIAQKSIFSGKNAFLSIFPQWSSDMLTTAKLTPSSFALTAHACLTVRESLSFMVLLVVLFLPSTPGCFHTHNI